jgi:hypothetical protein
MLEVKIVYTRTIQSRKSFYASLSCRPTSTSSRSSISGLSTKRLTSTRNDIIYCSLENIKYLRQHHIFEMRTKITMTRFTIHNLLCLSFGLSFDHRMIEATPHVFRSFHIHNFPLSVFLLIPF